MEVSEHITIEYDKAADRFIRIREGATRSSGYFVRVDNVFVRSADDVLGVRSVVTHLREWVFGLRVRRDYCAR